MTFKEYANAVLKMVIDDPKCIDNPIRIGFMDSEQEASVVDVDRIEKTSNALYIIPVDWHGDLEAVEIRDTMPRVDAYENLTRVVSKHGIYVKRGDNKLPEVDNE